ncbi:MAG: hypothetical protein EXS63_06055 [Candidatus Omnitrophica bacterium]|nr:hypothetical protein [Candidatus Omnitrophota bacterium]
MKMVLFIEQDQDIRDFMRDDAKLHSILNIQVRVAAGLEEADKILKREAFDGVLFDALEPSMWDILDFVRAARHRDYRLPMVALVGYHDMILNPHLKETLQKAQVSITDKVNALKSENLSRLLQDSCERGFGEELK